MYSSLTSFSEKFEQHGTTLLACVDDLLKQCANQDKVQGKLDALSVAKTNWHHDFVQVNKMFGATLGDGLGMPDLSRVGAEFHPHTTALWETSWDLMDVVSSSELPAIKDASAALNKARYDIKMDLIYVNCVLEQVSRGNGKGDGASPDSTSTSPTLPTTVQDESAQEPEPGAPPKVESKTPTVDWNKIQVELVKIDLPTISDMEVDCDKITTVCNAIIEKMNYSLEVHLMKQDLLSLARTLIMGIEQARGTKARLDHEAEQEGASGDPAATLEQLKATAKTLHAEQARIRDVIKHLEEMQTTISTVC